VSQLAQGQQQGSGLERGVLVHKPARQCGCTQEELDFAYGCFIHFLFPLHLNFSSKVFHRITECFLLEGTFRGHLAQPPCSEHGYLPLDQVAQSPIQPGLERSQGWGLHCLSGQSVPVFHHSYGKNFYLISSLNLPSLSLKPLLLVLSQQALLKTFFPTFPTGPLQVLKGC